MNQVSKAPSIRPREQRTPGLPALLPVLAAILAIAPTAWADTVDISNQPLATLPTVHAPPNLLFVMDTSGSMASAYMPDDMSNTKQYGYRSAQCNGVAYDPTQTYLLPVDASGNKYPAQTFTNAANDGYDSTAGNSDLTNKFYYQYKGTSAGVKQPVMGWTYDSNGALGTTFFNECTSSTSNGGSDPGKSVFTKVTLSNATAAVQQNYANWYSYYSKRYLMMRTAMGIAIGKLDASYNVGMTVISEPSAAAGDTFRDVKPFTASQKTDFYSTLYSAAPSGNTPLRPALAKAGQYFADKALGQGYDPVQYACQRNYALLSTDGYWNTGLETAAYGPNQLDGKTAVGNQDASDVSPMKDSTVATVTTTTTYQAPATRNKLATQTATIKWTRTATTVSSSNSGTSSNPKYAITNVTQTYNETKTNTQTTPQTAQVSYTHTAVTTDGVAGTPSDSAYVYTTFVDNPPATVALTGDTGAPTGSTSWTSGSPTPGGTQTTKGTGVATYNTPTAGAQSAWGSWSTPATFSANTPGTFVAGTPQVKTTYSGGDSNTLADVAEYYYNTDLRSKALNNCTNSTTKDTRDLCADIVPAAGNDTQTQQHMTTFTIGLGVNGTLPHTADTLAQLSASPRTLFWPTPEESDNGGNATNVDDLWHAAVNGRGQYYSALNATALSAAINGVVNNIVAVTGSGSAASTSSLQLVAGDNNKLYKASYTTGSWTGDLQAFGLIGETATVDTNYTWSAQTVLDNMLKANTPRKILFSDGSALQPFNYTALGKAGKSTYFDNLCNLTPQPVQCAGLSDADKTVANTGGNLVNYLAGANSYEAANASTAGGLTVTSAQLYRKRDHALGDIIDGAPVYVGKPPFSYADSGYADFVTNNSSRKPVVYTAANDGMLHAFSADALDGGTELWAYIPTMVMANMFKLADTGYANTHQYFVDGAPVMGDVKSGTSWKTILVGGLNDGGQGYYALDITDPAKPVLLWEFTDTYLGYTYGNPVITKRQDGTWVVVFGSGYNNTGGSSPLQGKGHLYVLDAIKGTKLLDIATSVGDGTTPSGLAKVNAWIENANDNTATRFYGGDLQGNLWRFDVDKLVQPNQQALQLAQFVVNKVPQPITTRPETVAVGNRAVIVVATGKYMGSTDVADKTQQSIYGVADNLDTTTWGDVRANTKFVQQTLTIASPATDPPSASITDSAVDFTNSAVGGWWVDLPNSGERVFTNMSLQFNTLAVSTAIPKGDACTSGGSSWRYYLDVTNGGVVTTNPAGQQWSDSALIVGMSWVKDSNGDVRVIYQDSTGKVKPDIPPTPPGSPNGAARRTSWRELSN